MSMNVNLTSMNSLNHLSKTIFNANQSMEKLSTGKRINNAGDDAAGLAISEKMTSQDNGYTQALRNAEDGASVLQTADGALNSTQTSLQRMRELAMQSANGTLSDSDREMLQKEYEALSSELDNIANQTEFNGQKLLDGSFTNKSIQVGANSDENISMSINAMSTAALGVDGLDLTTQAGSSAALENIDNALKQVSSEQGNLGALQNQLGYSANNLQVSSSNTSDSESSIRDLLTSKEVMDQVQNDLLMQTTISMLAQSNTNAQNVLHLLR